MIRASYRKLLRRHDSAVSPVIAVILMVAITVVLAATVYVWVSGFGSSTSTASRSVSLTSASAIDNTNNNKTYTVAYASSGLKWSDLALTLNGATLTYKNLTSNTPANGATEWCLWDPSLPGGAACDAGTSNPSTLVSAGAIIYVHDTSALSGKTLRVLDAQANSVIASLTIG